MSYKCPICNVKLLRTQYEGVNIFQCDSCRGTLLSFSKLRSIEIRREKSEDELADELMNSATDNDLNLRCVECLSRMEKAAKKMGSWSFFIDRCNRCEWIWLDAGELAKWQVIYEFSDKGEEAKRFQDRLANMTDVEKAEYEKRIANLPEENFAWEVVKGLARDSRIRHSFFSLWN